MSSSLLPVFLGSLFLHLIEVWRQRAESPMLLWCEAAFVAFERAGETAQLLPNGIRQFPAQLKPSFSKTVRLPPDKPSAAA